MKTGYQLAAAVLCLAIDHPAYSEETVLRAITYAPPTIGAIPAGTE
jgi:hypothetical protein